MNLKEKCRMLGLGCYGGKQAKEFMALGYKGNVANGSEQDLKALGDIPKFRLEGFDGFGGHRERAEDCLIQNSEFIDFIENIKEEIVFVFFGGGGSTGSGCATIVAEMLLQQNEDDEEAPKRIVCPVIALPSQDEPIAKHRNAYQAVVELQELEGLGATFFINNNSGKDYASLNSTFTKFLDTFLTNDSYGELNNFDESERLEMLKDSGMMVISLMGTKENQSLDQALMINKLTKDGIFAPVENNKICEHIAIIHAGRNNSDIEKDVVIAEVGKPKNIFEGYNSRNTLVAVSGLDYPVSHVAKLGEMAKVAYEERQRNRKHVSKLGSLDFMEDEAPKATTEKKTSSKLAAMRKKMKEMNK